MLAEPRNKQKWAADPRNTHWSEDKNKFGYQLMSKMGWSEGKGLGANESGQVEHVKVKKRRENLGLGSTTNHSENWLAHQDDFNALLSNLNQKTSKPTDGEEKVEENERSSLKHSVKQSRKKIFYSKFIHSKDLSLKSKNDLACVMGQRSKSTPATPQELSEDEGAKSDTSTASCPVGDADASHGIVTRNSEINLQDYFAQKMAALKKRKEIKDTKDNGDRDECESESIRRDGNECHSESNRVGGNERDSESTKGVSDECKSEPNKDYDVCKDVRKSKKKKRKDKENETKESEDGVKFFVGAEDIEEEIGLKKKKSKKSKKNGEEINEDFVNGDSSEIKRTGDERKGKKSEVQESVECVKSIVEEDDTEEEVGLQKKKKSKKSKKSSDEMNVNVVDDLDQVIKAGDEDDGVKKKKKSSKQRNVEKIGENGEEKLEKSKKSKSSDETSFNGSSKDLNEIEMAEIENKEGKIKKKKSSKNKTEKETVDDEEEIAKNKKKKKRKYDKNDEANDLECNDVKKIKKSKSSKD